MSLTSQADSADSTTRARTGQAPRCSLCGGATRLHVSGARSLYAKDKSFDIVRCESCGAGITSPEPTAEELAKCYAGEYDYEAHALIAAEKRWRASTLIDRVGVRGARSVLDVGCMHGDLLVECRERGVERLFGVEYSAGPAEGARARGLDVVTGELGDFAKQRPGERVDLIFVQHVLEHVREPKAFLELARSILAPGGRIVLCVPNMESRSHRAFGRAWGWWQVPVHLVHYSPESLVRLLGAAKLRMVEQLTRGGDSGFVLLSMFHSLPRKEQATASTGVKPKSAAERAVIKTASALARPYLWVGDEELVVVAEGA